MKVKDCIEVYEKKETFKTFVEFLIRLEISDNKEDPEELIENKLLQLDFIKKQIHNTEMYFYRFIMEVMDIENIKDVHRIINKAEKEIERINTKWGYR